MKAKKKREVLDNYCLNHKCDVCELCNTDDWGTPFLPAGHPYKRCLNIKEASNKDLDRALKLIGFDKDNPYWKRINKLAKKQREKGILTYGQGLEDNIIPDAVERISYIEEELIDALMYCEWLKDKLSECDDDGQ